MKHKTDWESLYRMSPVDQICYKYYQTTGQYLQDPDPQTIRLLLQSWPFYAQAQKMLPTEELLHRGETAKLEELFQWEQLGFVENSDVFVARVVRYCIMMLMQELYPQPVTQKPGGKLIYLPFTARNVAKE